MEYSKYILSKYVFKTDNNERSMRIWEHMDCLELKLYEKLDEEGRKVLAELIELIDEYIITGGEELIDFALNQYSSTLKNIVKDGVNN